MLQALHGSPPPDSQRGLKLNLKQQNFFLPCICFPEADLQIGNDSRKQVAATVTRKFARSPLVVELHLSPETDIPYRAGQHINLLCRIDDEDFVRSYSLSSHPGVDEDLVLQIALVDGGKVSAWIHDSLAEGESVAMQMPVGTCVYSCVSVEQPLLLAGVGTGLAPLYGILRDALHNNHQGPIHLFHGASNEQELYLNREFDLLHSSNDGFYYHPVVRSEAGQRGISQKSIEESIACLATSLEGWQVYLCGNPKFVKQLQKHCFLLGASSKEIFCDEFVSAQN